jgi:hypothetical protein
LKDQRVTLSPGIIRAVNKLTFSWIKQRLFNLIPTVDLSVWPSVREEWAAVGLGNVNISVKVVMMTYDPLHQQVINVFLIKVS